MGSTMYYRPPGETDLDHFRAQHESMNIIDGATKRGAFYAAVEETRGGKAIITCMVIKITRVRTKADDYGAMNFCVKEMMETSGPGYHDCPARILDQLSPVDEIAEPGSSSHEWASEWRSACRATIAKEADRPKIVKGDTIVFEAPYTLADADSTVEAVYELVDARKNTFRTLEGTFIHLPSTWRQKTYKVLTREERLALRDERARAYWVALEN